MAAQDTAALLIEYGNLFVGSSSGDAVNVGAVRNVKFMGKKIGTKVSSDNLGDVIDKVRLNGEIEAELLEVGNAAILESIFKGIVTLSSTAGSSTPVTGEVTASGSWAYRQIIFFAQQQYDLSVPTSVTVTGSVDGLLTVVTDYDLIKDPATGKWGVAIKDSTPVTTLAQTITLAYTSTPAASRTITGGTNQTATARYVKIEGPSEDDSNLKRTIIMSSAIAESDMLIPFVDVERANDVGVMPVRFTARKGSTWTLQDSINPS